MKYHIYAPIYGTAYVCVDAKSKDEAIDKAMKFCVENPCATGEDLSDQWVHSDNGYVLEDDVREWEIKEEVERENELDKTN